MLPWVCSVIDHRRRQNVVKTKKWYPSRSRECVTDVFTTVAKKKKVAFKSNFLSFYVLVTEITFAGSRQLSSQII